MGVYYTGMSGWDIARQVSAGLVENSDTWKKDALSLLMFAPEYRQQEAMRMVVSGQHTTTPDRLDRVFDLVRELPAVHEGESRVEVAEVSGTWRTSRVKRPSAVS